MRVKSGTVTARRHKKILKRAKGYRLSHSKNVRKAIETLLHARQYSYVARKKRPGQFKKLWIQRIGLALEEFGMSYSKFMANLKTAKVELNRKMLAELAVKQPEIFKKIAKLG
ncbi:MAG: 50S ribosomal protein L20 [Candidatus Dojkabacteria bacterium]|nr:MAG: 50S ribosomal protein L20 [Candidatus Dojkabacteria bacterium]